MAISKTAIVNKALTLVGATPIVNITDENENARVVNRVYEISLKSILAECLWTFATKRVLLTVSTDTLAWYDTGNTYVYVRPPDVLRIFGGSTLPAEWREEGDYIISDTQGLGIRYVYYIDAPSKYPPAFVEAFIDKLASDIAYMIVNSATLGERYLTKYYSISLPKAMGENGQIGAQQQVIDDAWEFSKLNNITVDG